MYSSHNLAIRNVGISPRWTEDFCPQKDLHLNVYDNFCHKRQNLEAPRYPSVGIWINKLWYIHQMKYSVLKWTELSSHEKKWKKLGRHIAKGKSQPEKGKHCMIPTIWQFGKSKTREIMKKSLVAKSSRHEWEHRTQGLLEKLNYSVWYCQSRYMSLYILSEPILFNSKGDP